MSSGSSPAGNITTTQAPLNYMQPYYGTALGQSANLLQTGGPQYYTGQQVASFNPFQNASMQNINDIAGSNPLSQASNFNNNLLTGDFSGPQSNLARMGTGSMNNPELSNLLNLQNQSIQSNLASQFAGSGRNLPASMPLQAQMMGNADSQLLSNAYNINQGNALSANEALGGMQQGAVGNSQNLLGANLGLQNALGTVGNQVQNQSQNLIDASKNAFNYNQQLPYTNLRDYESNLAGIQPGSQVSNPYFTNPAANTLGMGMGALGLYNGMSSAGLLGGGAASGGAKGAGAASSAPVLVS